jgi:hypothetical protein
MRRVLQLPQLERMTSWQSPGSNGPLLLAQIHQKGVFLRGWPGKVGDRPAYVAGTPAEIPSSFQANPIHVRHKA